MAGLARTVGEVSPLILLTAIGAVIRRLDARDSLLPSNVSAIMRSWH